MTWSQEAEGAGGPGGVEGAGGSVGDLRHRVAPWVAEALARSAELGFLGGMAVDDQIDHALGFVSAFESVVKDGPRAVIDLGSGGGVPGLILLSCWPESHIVLLDGNERRTEFLVAESAARTTGGTVEVIRGRAEEAARLPRLRQQFDLVSSRSFGPPAVAAECGAPFLTVGGLMVVSEPPGRSGEERWPVEELRAPRIATVDQGPVQRLLWVSDPGQGVRDPGSLSEEGRDPHQTPLVLTPANTRRHRRGTVSRETLRPRAVNAEQRSGPAAKSHGWVRYRWTAGATGLGRFDHIVRRDRPGRLKFGRGHHATTGKGEEIEVLARPRQERSRRGPRPTGRQRPPCSR